MTSEDNLVEIPQQLSNDIRAFFRTIAQESRAKSKKPFQFIDQARMSTPDSVTYMSNEQYKSYQDFISKLHDLYPHSKNYDKRYAERKFRDAAFQATNQSGDPKENAKEAFATVLSAFQHKLRGWKVFIPISGFTLHKKTSWTFGKVTFYKKTNKQFKSDAKVMFVDTGDIHLHAADYYAQVQVEAVDSSAAINLAIQEIEKHANVLNALGRLYGAIKLKESHNMYGFKGSVVNDWIMHCTTDRPGASGLAQGRSIALGGFNPIILKASYLREQYKWRWIEKQLKNPTSTLFEDRVLPSLKWIGKSSLRTNNEEIYLDYSLAVEALYFETRHTSDLMKELKIRMYRLLFTNTSWLSSAMESYNKFDYIYDLRSKIVHRGGVDISDNDIQLMYDLARASLMKMVHYPRFRNLNTEKFEAWLMSGRKKTKPSS